MFWSDLQMVAGIIFAIMGLMWVIYLLEKNPSVIDVGWSFSVGCTSLVLFLSAKEIGIRQLVMVILTLLWSIRITIFLVTRMAHGKIDPKYLILARNWKSLHGIRFFFLFFLQAAIAIIMMIPIIFVYTDPMPVWGAIDTIALLWFFFGFVGVATADYSLAHFQNVKENEKKVCSLGWWKYSRHPNYFFEINIWLSIALFASNSNEYGYLGFISPIILAILLLFVTGIPPEEKMKKERYGEAYAKYKRKTSLLIPWFPKKEL